MRIKIADIYIGDRQRRDYGKQEMEDLVNDLKENGQIQAITVRPPNDDDKSEEDYEGQPWVLVAGGRRVNAAALLGWPDIEGYAREDMSTLVAQILELHENIKRKAMTWQEQVDAKSTIARLRRMENPDITDGEIARELGESAATFSRDLQTAKILEQNPGLRKAGSKHSALNAGKILQENKARAARAADVAKAATNASGPLEERVKTSDALTFVRTLEKDSIDLTLIDGPYGYNYWKLGQKSSVAEGEHLSSYDDDPETVGPMYREVFPELVRVTRETGWLVMFCGKETYDFLEELAQDCCAVHASYRHKQYPSQCEAVAGKANPDTPCRFLVPNPYPWIWYRPNSRNRPRYPHLHAQNVVELILVVNMGKGRIVKQPCTNLLQHDAEYGSDRVHANQKPLALYRDLIERFTFSGDTVLDTFFGSGNSLAAAASLGRIPWGCDRNPEMLPFAHGKITQLQQLVSAAQIKESFERYQRGLAGELAETTVVEEETAQVAASGPRPVDRKNGLSWEFEVFRVGQEYIGYYKYDGHTMGQCRMADRDALEMEMGQGCQKLDQLSTLGALDPCCCTPEEAMEALKAYETAEEE